MKHIGAKWIGDVQVVGESGAEGGRARERMAFVGVLCFEGGGKIIYKFTFIFSNLTTQ